MSSPRRHVEVHTFTPPAGGTVDTAETALLSLLTAIERHPAGSPAITPFTAAIRRKGEELTAAGGGEALVYVLGRIHIAAPEKAAERERIISSAWRPARLATLTEAESTIMGTVVTLPHAMCETLCTVRIYGTAAGLKVAFLFPPAEPDPTASTCIPPAFAGPDEGADAIGAVYEADVIG